MKRRTLMMLGLCLLMALGPSLSHADGEQDPVYEPSSIEAWWGVAGAVLCGGGIRLAQTVPVVGMNPYVLAATIGGCVLAAIDLAT